MRVFSVEHIRRIHVLVSASTSQEYSKSGRDAYQLYKGWTWRSTHDMMRVIGKRSAFFKPLVNGMQ